MADSPDPRYAAVTGHPLADVPAAVLAAARAVLAEVARSGDVDPEVADPVADAVVAGLRPCLQAIAPAATTPATSTIWEYKVLEFEVLEFAETVASALQHDVRCGPVGNAPVCGRRLVRAAATVSSVTKRWGGQGAGPEELSGTEVPVQRQR